MAKSRYVEDRRFKKHLEHPTKATSLHPLGDALRQVSDGIRDDAVSQIRRVQAEKEATVQAIRHAELDANAAKPGQGYLRAKTEAFALKSAADTTIAVMTGSDGKLVAQVIINRQGSSSLEYGGQDTGVVLGQGSKQHPNHPAYAFLRRALDRAAR